MTVTARHDTQTEFMQSDICQMMCQKVEMSPQIVVENHCDLASKLLKGVVS